jgi:hypothetical protein
MPNAMPWETCIRARSVSPRASWPRITSTPGWLRDSWAITGPQLQAVMQRGQATWAENQPLTIDRRGLLETAYFTYAYSPT